MAANYFGVYASVSNVHSPRMIPVLAFALALSAFFGISFVICVIGYLAFPGLPINHAALTLFLPGFSLLTWSSFFLGLFESLAIGLYIAMIFGPIYNFLVIRLDR